MTNSETQVLIIEQAYGCGHIKTNTNTGTGIVELLSTLPGLAISENGEVFYFKNTSGVATISTDSGDITIDPAGGDVDFDACNICIDSGKKVMLEGVSGDTYIAFNSGSAQIDFYVNGALCGHVNAASGFVND